MKVMFPVRQLLAGGAFLALLLTLLTVFFAFLIFTPTNTSAQSGLCNLISSGESVSAGFGVPWSTLSSSRPLLLNSQCNDDEALLRAGTGSTLEYIYKTGYTWDGTAWDPFTFSGAQLVSNTWYVGDAYHVLADIPSGTTFWVGYVCTWTGQVWKCGCRDNSCATSYWQLQGVDPSNVTAGDDDDSGGGTAQGDDTFSCLSDFSGPTKTVSGNQGFTQYKTSDWSAGTKFDARNATFRAKWNPSVEQAMNILLGGNWKDAPESKMCWVGGTVTGENPLNETWCKNYSSNAFGISVNAKDSVVTGMRLHNLHDGIRFTTISSAPSLNFTIKDNWVTYNRDDCIENDAMNGGLIDDNLFDGCYVFYSAVNVDSSKDGSDNLVKVTNNVVRLQALPGARQSGGACDPNKSGHGMLWKIGDGGSPKLSIKDNVFLIEGGDVVINGGWMQGDHYEKIVECSNNTVVWAGGGSPPQALKDGINKHGSCFTLSTDRSIYDNAKQEWINRHQ